jgi:hypothetical protein
VKKFLALILIVLPVAAFAADGKPLSVKELCQRMVNVQSNGDADYVPNKDVHGNDVAPADLDGGAPQVNLSDNMTVEIGADKLRQLNLPGSAYTPYMSFGQVTVKKDGSVYFNGQRLTQPQTQSLCNDKHADDMNAPNNSGQTPPPSPPASR